MRLFVSMLACAGLAGAGEVRGVIADWQGRPLPGATVAALVDQREIAEAKTDSGGRFSLPGLPERCWIRASAPQHHSSEWPVRLDAGRVVRVRMALDVDPVVYPSGPVPLDYHDRSASEHPFGALHISARVAGAVAETPVRIELWLGRRLIAADAALREFHLPAVAPEFYQLTVATESALQSVYVKITPGMVSRVAIVMHECPECAPPVHPMPPEALAMASAALPANLAERPAFRLLLRLRRYR